MFVIYPAEELLRIYESHPCHVVASGFAPLNDPRSVEKGQRISEEDAKDVERRRCVDDKSSGNQGKSGNPATQKYSKAQKKSNRGKKRLWWFAKKHSNEKKTLNCSTSVDDRPTVCDSNRKNNDNINDNKVDNTKNNNKETKGSADPGKRGANSKVKGGNASSSSKSSSSPRRKTRDCAIMQNNRNTADEAAANAHPTINNPLKDLTQANLNEPLKQHNGNALKLVQTVSEFAQELSAVMESHGANVRRLVEEFRGKSGESTRGDSGGMRRVWENLLRQVEADASAHLDLAAVLQHQLARPTLESSFHRKIQSRKIFGYREAYEQVVIKSEEKLQRARVDYKRAYAALLTSGDTIADQEPLRRAYLESHNAYVLQLRATNAIVERYQHHCLPTLLGEISEVYEEVCSVTCNCIAGISEASAERAGEQAKRYTAIGKEAQTVAPANDLQIFARNLASTATPKKPPRRLFVAPSPPEQISVERLNQVPSLRDEIVTSGSANQTILEDLKRDADGLNQEIGRLQDALDALLRMQRKSAEGSLFTKVAELQEDISIKRFDLGVAYLHLAAVQAQKELFGAGEAGQPDPVSNRKMSNGSTGSNTKHKWLKAFKSLKTSSPTTPPPVDKKTLESEGGHQWREYTYRKITPCDACGQVLRGHISQGFRCRRCKVNAHADCINSVQPSVCPSLVPKKGGGIPLLRRQKTSAPPVEDAPSAEHNVDATYQVLKQAGEIRGNSTNSPPTPPVVSDQPGTVGPPSTTRTSSHPCSSSTSAPCSPGQGYPVHKHLRSAIRMSSMELPDDNEKSYSSASTSPCPSPHTNNQNHLNPSGGKRVLPPNNLYVVLYNFDARHRDELDLKAGYKITVIERSEKDWWKGKCLGGRAGYFPSAYVMRVESGQKTLQVTRNLQLADQTTLLRDQIVIQVGEEVDGVAMVRCAADTRSSEHVGKEGDVRFKETLCPLKYLQEV